MDSQLFPVQPERRLIEVVHCQGINAVLVNGSVFMSWKEYDEGSKRLAIVLLYRAKKATQAALSEAFGVHINTVGKYISRYEQEGLEGLIEHPRGPRRRWKVGPEIRKVIVEVAVRDGIVDEEKIRSEVEGKGVEVSRRSIREVLEENGLTEMRECGEEEEQRGLFDGAVDDQQQMLDFGVRGHEGTAGDGEGCSSESDRKRSEQEVTDLRAGVRSSYSRGQRRYLDRLEEGDYNAYAGGLLLTALIEKCSFLQILKRVVDIPHHEGYSLEGMCLTLLYLDVFGFRSIEDYKKAYAEEFGVLIGRATSPSPYSVRRFLHRVRALGKSEQLIDEFASEYLRSGIAEWGVMYIDGHFMPYYGFMPIVKGWHAVRQKGMKGSYNFLGVDGHFTPWIFLVRSAMEDLLQKIPEMVGKVREIGRKVGIEEERLGKLVVIFDREGYSADLYRLLDGREEGTKRVLFISWAKYTDKWIYEIPEESFTETIEVSYEIKEAEQISYHVTERTMSRYGKIRTIVIQSGTEKRRAAIYTNAETCELRTEEVIRFICRRWGEENLIKELLRKHMIDYTPGYVREPLDTQPLVDNPRVQELRQTKGNLTSEVSRLKVSFADSEIKRRQGSGEKKKSIEHQTGLLTDILRREAEIKEVEEQIKALPARIPFPDAHEGKNLVQQNYEKKRFLDCIKVFVYNMEKQLCSVLLKYYGRRKEIYPALTMILRRGGYIKLEGRTLKVRLRKLQNREIDFAARRLCEEVNGMRPVTVDTYRLPLHFGVL